MTALSGVGEAEFLPAGHHRIIADVATFQTTQGFTVTASRPGIVKVGKWNLADWCNLQESYKYTVMPEERYF